MPDDISNRTMASAKAATDGDQAQRIKVSAGRQDAEAVIERAVADDLGQAQRGDDADRYIPITQ
jgi:hypothetical protein